MHEIAEQQQALAEWCRLLEGTALSWGADLSKNVDAYF
jgi:hypothetical protein